MFVSEDLTVNEKNHLVIGKNDTVELAKEFGTPLYVLDDFSRLLSNLLIQTFFLTPS